MRNLSIALASPNLQSCSLTIENFTADTVSVKYSGLSGNQPKAYNNCLAIWEGTIIPWRNPLCPPERIPQDSQTGTFVMTGFTITSDSYIIGYAVGSELTEICACAQISAGGLRAPPDNVYISVANIGSNSLAVNYYTLPGYLPKTYRNWIGLWEGYASPYNAPKPIATAAVDSDSNQGGIAINDIALGINSTYTLVYFMGADEGEGWPRAITNAAAILTFNTSMCDSQ